MSQHEEHNRQGGAPPIDESLVINTRLREIEREQAEEKKRDYDYKDRQLRFNKLTLIFTFGLLVANIIYDGLTGYMAHTASVSAEAARSAAQTAADTLMLLSNSGAQSSGQVEAATGHLSRVAGAMEGSLDQNRKALATTITQGKAALDASIEASRADQRAWLGVRAVRLVQFEKGKSLKVDIDWFNSGKTPAIGVRKGIRFNLVKTLVSGPQQDWPTDFVFEPELSVAPQGTYTTHIEIAASLMETRQAPLVASELFAYVYGTVKYTDISKTFNGETNICARLGDANTPTPEMFYCSTFNEMK